MKKTILLVEDDERIVQVLKIRFHAAGYLVITAPDAVVAGMLALKHCPDLILLDISLPAGNGLMVAERLQNTRATASTPIIFLTASRQPGLREKAMALGAVGFFEKPYEPRKLLTAIADALHEPADSPARGRGPAAPSLNPYQKS
jgi:sigma-B regulation protein RsbU (phosphoserine phosphatase)